MNPSVLTFLGDVFPKHPVDVRVDLPGALVPNLEAPLTDHAIGYPGKINLRASSANLAATFTPLPLAVGLANNHIMDFGVEGFTDTVAELRSLGVRYFGAGDATDGFSNPLLVEVAGVTVALLGYAHESSTPVFHTAEHPGAARLELAAVTRDIAASRDRGAQRVVVLAHWGHEQISLPAPECVQLGRSIIDAGADLIIGHHAHCIQSYEMYAGKYIFYGLGNCIFPPHQSPSYFDATGRSTRRADSRPSLRNRRSLAVSWDPITEAVTITPLLYHRDALVAGHFAHRRHLLEFDSVKQYLARYARAYKWGKLQHTIARFVAKPKLPGLHHLRSIAKHLGSDTQR